MHGLPGARDHPHRVLVALTRRIDMILVEHVPAGRDGRDVVRTRLDTRQQRGQPAFGGHIVRVQQDTPVVVAGQRVQPAIHVRPRPEVLRRAHGSDAQRRARRRAGAQHRVIMRSIIGKHDRIQLVHAILRGDRSDGMRNRARIVVRHDQHGDALSHAAAFW